MAKPESTKRKVFGPAPFHSKLTLKAKSVSTMKTLLPCWKNFLAKLTLDSLITNAIRRAPPPLILKSKRSAFRAQAYPPAWKMDPP